MDIKELKVTNLAASSRHPWEQARLKVVRDLVVKFAGEGLKKEAPVLDIGCGDLFVAEKLASHFPTTPFYAIDTAFDAELIDALKDRLKVKNVDIFPSLDDAAAACSQPASAVLLLDVIEHIEDEVSFLKSLLQHPLINSETRIFITVPAFQGLYSGHDVFLGHFRRYNSRQLRETLKRAGFDIVTDGYFFSSLLLPRLLEVLIEKLIKDKLKQAKGVSNWNGAKVKDAVITSVLVLDFKIGQVFKKLNINVPGLSAYAVCKKSP
ncbi:MAG: class I SAM-dependent methyltransferase [Chlorobiales bacterium]|nr:class I SAM-dependent methyltransferase [Chlorobiales bacterium]